MCVQTTFIRKKSMEVFVIAHYEMKQRKGERKGGTHFAHLGVLIES